MKTRKRLLIWGLAILFLTGCTLFYTPVELKGDLIPLLKTVQPAVVTIVTYDINGDISDMGSGFFVDNHGHLITNYHVLKGAYAADVKTYDGSQYPIEGVVAENEVADLIKVRISPPEAPIDWIAVTETEPLIGERVLVVGSPLGLEQTVSEGIVSAIRELPAVGKVFQLSAPISPGSSGSPVVNMKGKVVGVVSFQAMVGQNLNFAISSKKVLALKKKENVKALSEWAYGISKRTPKLAEDLCRQGFNFSIRGEFKAALKYYQEATEKSPDDTGAWYGLGSCYDGLDRPEEAIAAYKQVILIDPDSAGAYFNLGQYYRKRGRYEEAIRAYNQAINVNPDHAPSYFGLGTLYSQLEEFEKGERAFKEVLRINPEHAPTYYYLGQTYNRLKRYQDAIESYKKALESNPDSAPVLYSLGLAYGSLGKNPEEVEAFKLAIRVNPDFAPVHYHMGLIYLTKGDKTAALEEYKILKRLDVGLAEMLFVQIY